MFGMLKGREGMSEDEVGSMLSSRERHTLTPRYEAADEFDEMRFYARNPAAEGFPHVEKKNRRTESC